MQSDALTRLTIRVATPFDASRLSAMALASFVDTFAMDNTPGDMALYTASAFGDSIQRAEILESRHSFLLAEQDDEIVGYALLREGPAPDSVTAHAALEINRFYVTRARIGSGVGAALMQRCIEVAESRGKDVIWLAVWEHNGRAIGFYERWGFTDVGSLPFKLGTDLQTDRVMFRSVQ